MKSYIGHTTRFALAILTCRPLLLTILGLGLFGTAMLAYAGALAGVALTPNRCEMAPAALSGQGVALFRAHP